MSKSGSQVGCQDGCVSWLRMSLLNARQQTYKLMQPDRSNSKGTFPFDDSSAGVLKALHWSPQGVLVPLTPHPRHSSKDMPDQFDAVEGNSDSVVVVVDPFSSGRYLVAELLKRGTRLVAVQSSPTIPGFLSGALAPDREALQRGESSRFLAVFDHIDDERDVGQDAIPRMQADGKDAIDDSKFITNAARATLKAICDAGFHVHAVVAGSEPGVELAEQLQAALGFSERNSVSTSLQRRDKYMMQEGLRRANLRAIKQKFAKSPDEVFKWMSESNMEFPIILKPAMGAGTEGVFKCKTSKDVAHAFVENCESGKQNICGVQNTGLLAQEFLVGNEYVVDSISCGKGQHFHVSIFKYGKLPDLTYEYTKVIESTGKVQDPMRAYIKKVLDALGLHFGASHAEVIVTKDGPCLVEVGARMHGALGPEVMQAATGFGLHEFVADLVIGGKAADRVKELCKKDYKYKLVNHAYEGKLNNRPEWQLTDTIQEEIGAVLPGIDKKETLSRVSVVQAELNFVKLHPKAIRHFHSTVHKGDELPITVDALTSPGVFLLVHESEQVCEDAIQAVRKVEKEMMARSIGLRVSSKQLKADNRNPKLKNGNVLKTGTLGRSRQHADVPRFI